MSPFVRLGAFSFVLFFYFFFLFFFLLFFFFLFPFLEAWSRPKREEHLPEPGQ